MEDSSGSESDLSSGRFDAAVLRNGQLVNGLSDWDIAPSVCSDAAEEDFSSTHWKAFGEWPNAFPELAVHIKPFACAKILDRVERPVASDGGYVENLPLSLLGKVLTGDKTYPCDNIRFHTGSYVSNHTTGFYTGTFVTGDGKILPHGYGNLRQSGTDFNGRFMACKGGIFALHGKFVVHYADGSRSVGMLERSLKFGPFTNTLPSGEIRMGEMKLSRKQGQWTHEYPATDNLPKLKVNVSYKNGLRYGAGTERSKNGTLFDGSWRTGNMHGLFTITNVDGSTYTARYEDGIEDHAQRTDTVYPNGKRPRVEVEGGSVAERPPSKRAGEQSEQGSSEDAEKIAELQKELAVLKGSAAPRTREQPEQKLVQETHMEWEKIPGVKCIGGTPGSEVLYTGGQTRRGDSEVQDGDKVALVEFKASGKDCDLAMGQVVARRKRELKGKIDGKPTPFAEADKKKKATLCVACGTKPDDTDIEACLENIPRVDVWFPGQPIPTRMA